MALTLMWMDIRDYYPKFTIFLGKEHDPDIQCEGASAPFWVFSLQPHRYYSADL